MGGVDDHDIDTFFDEGGDAVELFNADGGADTEAATGVFAGSGVLVGFVDVTHGDHADEVAFVIDEEEFFDAGGVEEMLGLFEGGVGGCGDRGCFWT